MTPTDQPEHHQPQSQDRVEPVVDPYMPEADHELTGDGLGEQEVKGPEPDVLSHSRQVRLDDRLAEPVDRKEETHDDEQLVVGPSPHRFCKTKIGPYTEGGPRQPEETQERIRPECGSVLQFGAEGVPPEDPEKGEIASHPPTA